MTLSGWIQIAVLFIAVLAITKPLGLYMFKVFSGERTWVSPVLVPVERAIYRVSGVDETKEQSWLAYAIGLLLFSLVGLMLTFVILRTQGSLPWNPEDFGAVKSDLAFGTSASFTTNTNWQAYSGETHDELLQPDGRPRRAQLYVRCGRHLRGAGADPGPRAAPGRHRRQFLGGPDPQHSVCPAAHLVPDGARPRLAGGPADPQRLWRCDGTGRHRADAGLGPHRQPGGDQGTRHKRRRLPQRQLGPPLREPKRPH